MIDKYTISKSLELIENALLGSLTEEVPFHEAAETIFDEIKFLKKYVREA